MTIHLNEEWIKRLSKLPETGMGSQHIDFFLQGNRVLRNVTVFNCEECQSVEAFDPNDIIDAQLSDQANERGSGIVEDNKQSTINLIHFLWELTVTLVKLDGKMRPSEDYCCGFFYQKNGKTFLLSAGHGLGSGQWFLETRFVDDSSHKSLLIPLNSVFTLESVAFPVKRSAQFSDIDFAWCEVDFTALKTEIGRNVRLKQQKDFVEYRGPLDAEPVQGSIPYTFGGWRGLLRKSALGRSYLLHEGVYETYMAYAGLNTETGLYRFRLASPHKGDGHYKGCSGSPIVDPEGKIISILLRGDEEEDLLFGLPIAKYERCIGLE